MTATSTDVILKILKQMSFSLINGNKVNYYYKISLNKYRSLSTVMLEEEEQD